jgi:hypothetical protein
MSWVSSGGSSRTGRKPTFRPTLLRLEDRIVPTVTLSTQIPGLQFSNTAGSTPPDTDAAVGQSSIIETVNTNIALYSKSGGSPLFNQSLDNFFSSVRSGNFWSDPVVAYDEQTQQFFVGVLDLTVDPFFGIITSDQFDYAVSAPGADPTASNFNSDFTFYSVDLTNSDPAGPGSYFGDYPRLGWNANAFVVSFNMFTADFSESYDHPLILNISTANPATTQVVDVPNTFHNSTVVPAVMHGSSTTDPMYLVEETLDINGNPTGNSISVGTETNLFNSNGTIPMFAFTPINVDLYTLPPAASQKGSSAQMETNDSRILNAEWRDGTLVASQTVGVSTDAQAHARWYQFSTSSTAKPALVQQGTIGLGSGANSYFPSIAINANGDVGMTYMESSSTEYVSMYVTGRTSSDPTGQMQTPVLAKAGQAPYTSSIEFSSPYRAGDFSGITVDPTDGSFWAANEYATTVSAAQSTNWGTAIAQFHLSQPAPPPNVTSPASASPSPVTTTSTTLSVTATDPGGQDLTYQWSVLSVPTGAAAPTFTNNNQTLVSGATDSTGVTFHQAGSYTFRVTITDANGGVTTSDISVKVDQTQTSLAVSPASVKVRDGRSQKFTATLFDQFGKAMAVQPTSGFTWTLSGGGSLATSTSNTDTYKAPNSGSGTATITVKYGTLTATAKVNYAKR